MLEPGRLPTGPVHTELKARNANLAAQLEALERRLTKLQGGMGVTAGLRTECLLRTGWKVVSAA